MQPRRSAAARHAAAKVTLSAFALLVAVALVGAQKPATPAGPSAPTAAGTLNRIRAAGQIRLGYRTDARPFSYRDDSGSPAGYSIELCQRIVDEARSERRSGDFTVDWVPVTVDDRFRAVQQGLIDLLCGADTVTLARRADVSFSIPIFPGGVGALVRGDAPARLRDVLAGRGQTFRPTWRASATQVLQSRFFSVVAGTTAERWLVEKIGDLKLIATVSRVGSYDAALQSLLDRRADVVFGERAVLLDSAKRHPSPGDLVVIDRLFTYEPLALALGRGDEAFRLLVDRTLSRLYESDDMVKLYGRWFPEPDENTLTFFRWNALPD